MKDILPAGPDTVHYTLGAVTVILAGRHHCLAHLRAAYAGILSRGDPRSAKTAKEGIPITVVITVGDSGLDTSLPLFRDSTPPRFNSTSGDAPSRTFDMQSKECTQVPLRHLSRPIH